MISGFINRVNYRANVFERRRLSKAFLELVNGRRILARKVQAITAIFVADKAFLCVGGLLRSVSGIFRSLLLWSKSLITFEVLNRPDHYSQYHNANYRNNAENDFEDFAHRANIGGQG